MTIEEQVLEKLRDLPPERKEEVLEFVDSLRKKDRAKKPLHSLRGLWRDFNIEITEKDIAEARREMWGNFPRERLLMSAVLDTHAAHLVPTRREKSIGNGFPTDRWRGSKRSADVHLYDLAS